MKTVKLIRAIIITLFVFNQNASIQNYNAHDLLGTWLTTDGTGHIHIYNDAG